MEKFLVGFTGFVGSNLADQTNFDGMFNSKNINDAFYREPDLLIYSGIRAEKFLANKEPEKDLANVKGAIDNIKKINPQKLVLISTIDVYTRPYDVDEDTAIDREGLHPYGRNRYFIEEWVENNLKDYLIIRLPGLYGKNLKKNFIYDLINIIPTMLSEFKFSEIENIDSFLSPFYTRQDNGFYRVRELSKKEREELKGFFNRIGFSALNFTDSRGRFQFYNLAFLWEHINHALRNGIKKLNIATESVQIGELYRCIKGAEFINGFADIPPDYNFKTKYHEIFGGKEGYIFDKEFIINDIKNFVEANS